MSFPLFAERRLASRKKLTGLLPGKLILENGKGNVSARTVDITPHGLGIISPDLFKVGASLLLKVAEMDIRMEVMWGQPDFGKHDLYRYGLLCRDTEVDLEEIFIKSGCLK